MDKTIWITLAVSVMGSSAVFGFIQFLIARYDAKHDKLADLKATVNKIDGELSKLRNRLQIDIEEVYDKIRDVRSYMDEMHAISARVRILRASDDLRLGTKFSKEFFHQISDDITLYEQYCRENKDFKNNRAVQAIENINRVYQEKLKDNDFL